MNVRQALVAVGMLSVVPQRVASDAAITLTPASMARVTTIDQRYQSYNVEMAEVVGANFWKPYKNGQVQGSGANMFQKRPPINLTDARLRKLAAALAPAYMRVSGTWANSVYFADRSSAGTAKAPKGFQSVLTRAEWKRVVDFSHAVNARLVTSFAISPGVRNAAGVWTPEQARRFIAYTKSAGGDISAAEFFNEPSYASIGGAPKGYKAADYARDSAVFKVFARKAAPHMAIVGPGSVGESGALATAKGMPILHTAELLNATPRPKFDIYSYHSYAAASIRCASLGAGTQTSPAVALSKQWLSSPAEIYAFYIGLRNEYEPRTPVWITETADAACGGNPWASTFLDTFRYLDQLGWLAKDSVQVVFHNTLASSAYGLLDENTFSPRPNYWAALLWHRLMGNVVLDAGSSPGALRLYAHCLPGHAGGVTILAINTSKTAPQAVRLAASSERYTLTAHTLNAGVIELNGRDLALAPGNGLPAISGEPTGAGTIVLAPASITFLAVPGASNPRCR